MQTDCRRWSLLLAAVLHLIPREEACKQSLPNRYLMAPLLLMWARTYMFIPRSNKKQIDWDQLDKEVGGELEAEEEEGLSGDARSVSYTHLTLPTILLV